MAWSPAEQLGSSAKRSLNAEQYGTSSRFLRLLLTNVLVTSAADDREPEKTSSSCSFSVSAAAMAAGRRLSCTRDAGAKEAESHVAYDSKAKSFKESHTCLERSRTMCRTMCQGLTSNRWDASERQTLQAHSCMSLGTVFRHLGPHQTLGSRTGPWQAGENLPRPLKRW